MNAWELLTQASGEVAEVEAGKGDVQHLMRSLVQTSDARALILKELNARRAAADACGAKSEG